jgi:hypothetical protein
MGTEITLSVDEIDVAWSKNKRGTDHGALFQESNRQRMKSDQINYEYFSEQGDEGLAEMEAGFSNSFNSVASRLELLGFSLDYVRREYEHKINEHNELLDEDAEEGVPFDEFLEIIGSTNISSLSSEYVKDQLDKGPESYGTKVIDKDHLVKIPLWWDNQQGIYSEQSFVAALLSFLHPYSALRLLAVNEANLDQRVTWQYGPLVDSGWAKVAEFQANARRRNTFLIVTEGHTDAAILKLAIETLRPEISDFFEFIDMTDGHPFGGTGPLQKFAKGLAQMDVHNQTLFLFDNDTEGLSAFNKTNELNLPPNMRVALLPNLIEFETFQTIGPSGDAVMDINGKAAAIECYLDFDQPNLPDPIVRWSGYKGDVKQYQGALQKKDKFTKDFVRWSADDLRDSGYNLSKLNDVVDVIYQQCIGIAEDGKKSTIFGAHTAWSE